MTGYDLLEAVGYIDVQYINSAAEEPRPRRAGIWKRVAAAAACVAVAAAVCISVIKFSDIFGGQDAPAVSPSPTDAVSYREVEPTDARLPIMSDYSGSYKELVVSGNTSCIIRGKVTDAKEYAFDYLKPPRKGVDFTGYQTLVSVEIKDVIWSDGSVPDAGASIDILYGDTSYRRNADALEYPITLGREYIFIMFPSKSHDGSYDYDKLSDYRVHPEYFLMSVNNESVYYLDFDLIYNGKPMIPDSEEAGRRTGGRQTDYSTMKAYLTDLMESIYGEQDAAPESFASFAELFEDMRAHYGMTLGDYYKEKGYTDGDFDEQFETQLKYPIKVNGIEYTESLSYAADIPAGGRMVPEKYNEYRRLSGFSLKTDVYEGENAIQDVLADAGELFRQVKDIIDKSKKWTYGDTHSEDYYDNLWQWNDIGDSLEALLDDPDSINTVPWLMEYIASYIVYDDPPEFFAELPEGKDGEEPHFAMDLCIFKEDKRSERETGWSIYFTCGWYYPVINRAEAEHETFATLTEFYEDAKRYFGQPLEKYMTAMGLNGSDFEEPQRQMYDGQLSSISWSPEELYDDLFDMEGKESAVIIGGKRYIVTVMYRESKKHATYNRYILSGVSVRTDTREGKNNLQDVLPDADDIMKTIKAAINKARTEKDGYRVTWLNRYGNSSLDALLAVPSRRESDPSVKSYGTGCIIRGGNPPEYFADLRERDPLCQKIYVSIYNTADDPENGQEEWCISFDSEWTCKPFNP